MRTPSLNMLTTPAVLISLALGAGIAQAQTPTAAVNHAVKHRYPHQTAGREVTTRCRRVTVHRHRQFSCLYGISQRLTLEEGLRGGEEGCVRASECQWAYSGLAQVYVHGTRLIVELLGPLQQGSDFAPYHSRAEREAEKREGAEAKAEEEKEAAEAKAHEEEAKRINEQLTAAEEELCKAEEKLQLPAASSQERDLHA